MAIPTDVDATWLNPTSYDAGELRRADAALYAGIGSAFGVGGGIVRHGDTSLGVTVDGSDVVTIQAGAVVVPGNAVSGTGCYRFGLGASITGALSARNATNPRIDLVVARAMDDDVVTSHDAYAGRFQIIAGTPAASPTVPALPSMAVELGRITVPNTAGGAASVDLTHRTFATSVGAELPVPTSSMLPASAATYQRAIALDTGVSYRWSGSSWINLGGLAGWQTVSLSAGSGWTIDSARAYVAQGVVHPDIRATRTGSTISPSSGGNITPDLSLATGWPTALRPSVTWPLRFERNGVGSGTWRLDNTGALNLTDFYPGNSIQSGDSFTFAGSYPLG